jgi:hypothetical protein
MRLIIASSGVSPSPLRSRRRCAKTDKRIGDPDTGVGLPDFGVNNAGIVEEGDKQRAKPMPIGFGKVRTDQQLIVEWADNVFVRRGRLF